MRLHQYKHSTKRHAEATPGPARRPPALRQGSARSVAATALARALAGEWPPAAPGQEGNGCSHVSPRPREKTTTTTNI
eukprot:6908933-Pyramimonas_sp.AAC.1